MTQPPGDDDRSHRSVLLVPSNERLWPFVIGAAVGHGAVGVALVVVAAVMALVEPPPAPLIDPDATMTVSVVAMDKSTGLPQLATRAPRAAGTPEPVAQPTPQVPQSDLAFQDPQAAPPTPQRGNDEDARLRELQDELAMADALAGLDDAPVGDQDRHASSPDGVAGSRGWGIGVNDPYIAALRAALDPLFQPPPSLRGTGLVTVVFIRADAEGNVLELKQQKSSGDPSWDRQAMAAARALNPIPKPPADKVAAVAAGFTFQFGDP